MLRKSLIALSFLSSLAFAGVDTHTDANGVILAGHDAVAYFTESKPVLGSSEFTSVYNDAIYRFSSEANRDAFNADPSKYAPAYGGYCAVGASFGKKFDIDGKAFEIVDGKLYVNKNVEVHEFWSKDITGNLAKSENNWGTIKDLSLDEIEALGSK